MVPMSVSEPVYLMQLHALLSCLGRKKDRPRWRVEAVAQLYGEPGSVVAQFASTVDRRGTICKNNRHFLPTFSCSTGLSINVYIGKMYEKCHVTGDMR